MRLTKRVVGDVVVVRIEGTDVVNNTNREALYDTVKGLALGNSKILIDMENVSHINSAGIGTIVALFRDVADANGTVKFVRVQEKVRSLFEITKLDQLFEIFPDEASAIASMP